MAALRHFSKPSTALFSIGSALSTSASQKISLRAVTPLVLLLQVLRDLRGVELADEVGVELADARAGGDRPLRLLHAEDVEVHGAGLAQRLRPSRRGRRRTSCTDSSAFFFLASAFFLVSYWLGCWKSRPSGNLMRRKFSYCVSARWKADAGDRVGAEARAGLDVLAGDLRGRGALVPDLQHGLEVLLRPWPPAACCGRRATIFELVGGPHWVRLASLGSSCPS